MPHKNPADKLVYMARYRQRNAEAVGASIARWRAAHPDYDAQRYAADKDRMLTENRAWREANRDRRAAYRKAWTALNPEYRRRWIADNRGRVQAQGARRRAAKLNATVAWADQEAIALIYAEAAWLRAQGQQVEVDHIVPLQGREVCGLHVENNLAILPMRANRAKANRLVSV